MFNSLSPLLRSILYAAAIGLGGALIAFLVSSLFSKITKKTWGHFVGSFLAVTIIAWTIKLILDVTGAVGVLVIFGTALTGALSLGSEHFFSDIVAGVKLFFTRPFKEGDMVAIGDCEGRVLDIALTYTLLLDGDGNQVIVHNSDVVTGTIVKFQQGMADKQITVQIALPVSPDLDKAVSALQTALKDFSPQSPNEGTKPAVVCDKVAEGKMTLLVSAYISRDLDQDAEKTRLMAVALRALKQNDINLG